jgi:hypothetical protein
MEKGTIVLTRFPFTDLSSAKRRPSVIISKTDKNKKKAHSLKEIFISSAAVKQEKIDVYVNECKYIIFSSPSISIRHSVKFLLILSCI